MTRTPVRAGTSGATSAGLAATPDVAGTPGAGDGAAAGLDTAVTWGPAPSCGAVAAGPGWGTVGVATFFGRGAGIAGLAGDAGG
jgi:hypothetical protein